MPATTSRQSTSLQEHSTTPWNYTRDLRRQVDACSVEVVKKKTEQEQETLFSIFFILSFAIYSVLCLQLIQPIGCHANNIIIIINTKNTKNACSVF